jgi:glycerol uptake facilitator-like aquaporin
MSSNQSVKLRLPEDPARRGPAVSGGAFNPAVAIGVAVLGLANGANLWIYRLSEFLGAAVAAALFLLLNQEKLREPSRAAQDSAQEQTNQSIRAV